MYGDKLVESYSVGLIDRLMASLCLSMYSRRELLEPFLNLAATMSNNSDFSCLVNFFLLFLDVMVIKFTLFQKNDPVIVFFIVFYFK